VGVGDSARYAGWGWYGGAPGTPAGETGAHTEQVYTAFV
jgi:hypothetical protein